MAAMSSGHLNGTIDTNDFGSTEAVGYSEEDDFVSIVPHEETGGGTEVDIIAVPAIGSDPEKTWTAYISPSPRARTRPLEPPLKTAKNILTPATSKSFQGLDDDGRYVSRGPWLTTDLPEKITQARVLLYDHGKPKEGDTLNDLAERLLEKLKQQRGIFSKKYPKKGKYCRPIFFICHSTGGLVAKKALILANQRREFESIAHDCYGITFIATPHQGSVYLSSKEFSPSIFKVMQLRWRIPDTLQQQFSVKNDELSKMAEQFKPYSADLRVNTYYEMVESDLAFTPANDMTLRPYHAAITSIKSAIMDLEHESEFPLASDHVGCAVFEGESPATKDMLMLDLKAAVSKAADLSRIRHYPENLKDLVNVEVNGFFEDSQSSVKIWTARPSLQQFLDQGPRRLLKNRLQESKESKRSDKASNRRTDIPGSPALVKQTSAPLDTLATASHRSKRKSKRQKELGRPKSLQVQAQNSPNVVVQDIVRSTTSGQTEESLSQGAAALNGLTHMNVERDRFGVNPTNRPPMNSNSLAHPSHPAMLRRGSVAPPDGVPSDPGPQLPAMKQLKLTWVHIPYTHAGWVPEVLRRLSKGEGPDVDDYLRFLEEEHWSSNHNRGRHAAPHARFVKSSFVNPSKGGSIRNANEGSQFAVYLQYLHWDTYARLLERRNIIERRMKQERVRPIREDIAASKSIETKLIWQYLGSEPPLHCRRTLDQFGYPNLRSCEARDDDQMLWKRTRPKSSASVPWNKSSKESTYHQQDSCNPLEPSELQNDCSVRTRSDDDEALRKRWDVVQEKIDDGNVLMVDQLWLWVMEDTIVTFFPRKEAMFSEGKLYQQGDLHNSIYSEINAGLLQPSFNCMDLAGLIMQRATTVLLERTAHRHLQVLRIFEESLSILIERMTKSYKDFRSQGFSVRPDAYNRRANGQPMTSEEKLERDRDIERRSREDLSSLLELRDILDELDTIKRLFEEQEGTVAAVTKHYSEAQVPRHDTSAEAQESTVGPTRTIHEASETSGPKSIGLRYLEETEKSLKTYTKHIDEMVKNAEKAQVAYSNLLDIKQKQANVDESRLARSQADATAAQSRSILVFTIFTIIFLPLSFFTSLFGMNAREWSGTETNVPLHKILLYTAPISVSIIVFALLLAFSTTVRFCAVIFRKVALGIIHDFLKNFTRLFFTKSVSNATTKNTPASLNWLSERYLRHKEKYNTINDNIWDDYALPIYQAPRDTEHEKAGFHSWKERIFSWSSDRSKGEKDS